VNIDYPRAGRDDWRRFVPSWRQTLAVCGGGVLLLVLIFVIAYFTVSVPDPNKLALAQTTTFMYADGKTVLGTDGAQNRQSVELRQVPVAVQHAMLAAEDRKFFSEPGISVPGMARALWVDVTGGDVQGGSTITQQYAKNAYLSQKRSVFRKLKEIVIAVKLSHSKSKDEILQDYLNTIYFGRGAYGIQTAAQTYFGRDASQLDVSQAALLAAVIRGPALFDPARHPDRAKARWQYVLNGMVKQKWLTAADAAKQKFPPANLRTTRAASPLAGPKGYVIRAAEADLAKHGVTQERLDLGGLRVTTTLVRRAQDAAVKAVDETLPSDAPKDLRTAIAAVEPGSGKVLALYGGADYQKRQFDDAIQGRAQPGSSFKPFTLVTALEHGIPLSQTFDGRSPQTIAGQKVRNFADEQFGKINLVDATAHSVNTVYYQLGLQAGGPQAVAETAAKAGITTKLDPSAAGGSIFLGGGESVDVHPIDQADAFATFAAQGEHAPAYLVEKVTDSGGHTIYSTDNKTDRAFDSDVMADTTAALQAVLKQGTATGARLAGNRPAAGKTGTTSGNTAAWFVGYTPQMSAAVALFRDNNKPLQGILGRSEVTGGSIPATLWKTFMNAALEGQPIKQFPARANVGGSPSATPSATPTATPTQSVAPKPVPSKSLSVQPSNPPSPSGPPLPSIPVSPSPAASAGAQEP
jgi:membrane peptidoglycan carboxypeptidase